MSIVYYHILKIEYVTLKHQEKLHLSNGKQGVKGNNSTNKRHLTMAELRKKITVIINVMDKSTI